MNELLFEKPRSKAETPHRGPPGGDQDRSESVSNFEINGHNLSTNNKESKMSDIRESNNRPMKKVRIDESLLEQIEWYDVFPKGVWSKQARVNYLVQIGLAVLLVKFERECRERPPESGKVDLMDQIIRDQAVEHLLLLAAETRIPRSELARLVNRSLCE